MSRWLRPAADGSVTVTLHVQPGASHTAAAGMHGDALKVRLAAPPVDGKANAELLRFLAEVAGVPKSMVQLVTGATSRRKVVRLLGGDPARLHALAEPGG